MSILCKLFRVQRHIISPLAYTDFIKNTVLIKRRFDELYSWHPVAELPLAERLSNWSKRAINFGPKTKAPFTLRSLKWDRSEIDLRSVLRSVRDRMRTCSHWRLLIRQIIRNLGGLSSLFTLWLRVRWVAWHRPAFFFGHLLTFHGNLFFFFFFSIIRVGLCLGNVYRVMGCTLAVWRTRTKQL